MRLAAITKIGLAGLALAAALGAGSARAAIPSPDGSIDGCLNPTTGALRAVDTQAGQGCSSFERAVRWNLAGQQGTQGPAGSQGPSGPQGPPGPAGPAGPDTLIVSRRFSQGNGGQVPGCVSFPRTVICRRLDAGTVSLPPGVWEVTAQLWVDNYALGVLQDNRREVTCGPEPDPFALTVMPLDLIQAMTYDSDQDVRVQWTWIVENPGPGNLSWNLGCYVSFPLRFSWTTDDTRVQVNHAVIIARPVASVIYQ